MFELRQTTSDGGYFILAASEFRSFLEIIIMWHVENAKHIVQDLNIVEVG